MEIILLLILLFAGGILAGYGLRGDTEEPMTEEEFNGGAGS